MSHGHKRIVCACGRVLMQCRCMGPKATETRSPCSCAVAYTHTRPDPAEEPFEPAADPLDSYRWPGWRRSVGDERYLAETVHVSMGLATEMVLKRRTFVRSPEFPTPGEAARWLNQQGAKNISVERGPTGLFRGSGEVVGG